MMGAALVKTSQSTYISYTEILLFLKIYRSV